MNSESPNKIRVNWEQLEYQGYQAYYHAQPFTGIAEEYLGEDYLYNETEFVDGWEHGLSRIYSETKQILVEKTLYKGISHGLEHEWYESGRLACVTVYDRGFRVQQIKWDEDGAETERFELSPLDNTNRRLEKKRGFTPNWPEVSRNLFLKYPPVE